MLHPLLLGVGSSTDNFCVGVSHGIQSNTDQFWNQKFVYLNVIISCCNALGAAYAGYLSHIVLNLTNNQLNASESSKSSVFLFSGLAFYYLSYVELFAQSSYENNNDNIHIDTKRTRHDTLEAIKLAIPMTLNNVAGGMIGGLSGIQWVHTMFFSFVCSFVLMSAGYGLSRIRLLRHIPGLIQHSNVLSGVMFGLLGNDQVIKYYCYTYCS